MKRNAPKVHAETNGKRIVVRFPYHPGYVALIKDIPGRSFLRTQRAWSLPLTMDSCRDLRQLFGAKLVVGKGLKKWAREQVRLERVLGELSGADDAELKNLPYVDGCRKLYESLRPYQRVAAAFIAGSVGTMLADQPGLGKTRMAIAGVLESFPSGGLFLVIAPRTSLKTVWGKELKDLQPYPVFVATSSGIKRLKRETVIEEFFDADGPKWLVINPAMARKVSEISPCEAHEDESTNRKRKCSKNGEGCEEVFSYAYPELLQVDWDAILIDECHKEAVRKKNTLHRRGIVGLRLRKGGKKVALSGTPMRNRLSDLWGILNWLDPTTFGSEWRFMEQFSEKNENRFAKTGFTFTGKLDPFAKKSLFRALKPYVLRRTKREVLKDLPPKQRLDVWCDMTPIQERQYRQWEEEAEIVLEGKVLGATGVLDELTRLKQFAIAPQKVIEGKLFPEMKNSGKFEALWERLEERGMDDPSIPGEEAQKALVFSQFAKVIRETAKELERRKVPVAIITGATKQEERDRIVEEFQTDEGPRVLLMTTQAGGTAITLDRADSVHFLDETWLPDDQEQAEDRAHRFSRIERTNDPLTIYYYRSSGTIEESIQESVAAKAKLQFIVMDGRRGVPALK